MPIGTWAFGTEDKGLSRLVDIINEDLCGVNWDTINQNLKDFWIAIEPYAEEFGEGLIDFFEWISDQAFSGLENLFGKDGLLSSLTNWLNAHDPESARGWAHALTTLFTALFLFKLLKQGISIISTLFKLFGKTPNLEILGKGLAVAGKGISSALTSLGGFSGLMTTDLATIFGAGTATEIGVTIGTGLIGGILAAVGGFELGKVIGKLLFPDDAEWYDNFKWLGEGGFFDTISSDWKTSFKALDEMGTEIQNSKLVQFLTGDIAGLMGKKHKTWDETKAEILGFVTGIKNEVSREWEVFMRSIDTISSWYENSVKPWFTAEKWSELFQNIMNSASDKWKEIKDWWNTSALVVWWNNDVSPWFTREKWSGIFHNIQSSLTDKWNSIKQWWDNNALVKWWRESVEPWFSKERWLGGMVGIKDGFKEAFKNACNAGIEIFNKFIGWVNDKMNISWGGISVLGNEIVPAGNIQLLNIPSLPMLAEGGYVGPNQPQLAMIGDNQRHGEIVSPEDKMLEIMLAALEQFFSRLQSTGQQAPVTDSGDIIIPIYLGQEKIDEIIITAEQRRNMRSGGR